MSVEFPHQLTFMVGLRGLIDSCSNFFLVQSHCSYSYHTDKNEKRTGQIYLNLQLSQMKYRNKVNFEKLEESTVKPSVLIASSSGLSKHKQASQLEAQSMFSTPFKIKCGSFSSRKCLLIFFFHFWQSGGAGCGPCIIFLSHSANVCYSFSFLIQQNPKYLVP